MSIKIVLVFCIVFILSFTLIGCGLFELVGPDGSVSTPGINAPSQGGTAPISVNLNLLVNFIVAYVAGKLGYRFAPSAVSSFFSNLLKLFTPKK